MDRVEDCSRGTRFLGLLLALALTLPGQVVHPAAAEETDAVFMGNLVLGGALFQDGEYVAQARANVDCADGAHDPAGNRACWAYTFELLESGPMLRIAIDSATRGDVYVLCAEGPDGNQCDGNLPPITAHQFNRELVFENPTPGDWTIRVVANDVEDWAFRLRAALLEPPGEPELLTPNLRVWLPYEFGFVAPANPQAGSAGDRENPPGPPGISCTPDEGTSRCLRFSTGVHNVGDGPLYLRFDENDRAFQHVYYSDATPGNYEDNENEGNYREFEAGFAEFHPSHGHRHFEDMVLYELFEVVDRSPKASIREQDRLVRIGDGGKHGYCTGDQAFGYWKGFDQDRAWAPLKNRGCQSAMALGKGWGDIYRWQRPGQYVPYDLVSDPDGTMRGGFYVVRVTVDPNGLLVETRNNDNVGYAYIRVIDDLLVGDRVVICERGFGTSPWDRRKRLPEEPFWWTLRASSQAPAPGECS